MSFNNNTHSKAKDLFPKNEYAPEVEKLLEVRKNLNDYLKNKSNNQQKLTINSNQSQNELNAVNQQNNSFNFKNNNIAISKSINYETNNNKNSNFDSKQTLTNNINYNVIRYEDDIDKIKANELCAENHYNEFEQPLKIHDNPYSEIEKYDKLLASDKPYNYFSNYNYNYTNIPSTTTNAEFQRKENTIKENKVPLYKRNYFNNNNNNNENSISYLDEIKRNNLNTKSTKIPGNIPEDYNLDTNEPLHNKFIEKHKNSIEHKINDNIYKSNHNLNNTTLSNLTTIQSK